MNVRVLPDPEAAARAAAHWIAAALRKKQEKIGRFTCAFSGGRTPEAMLRELAEQPVDWSTVDVFQVDERAVPWGSSERNARSVDEALVARLAGRPPRVHYMPVEVSLEDPRAHELCRDRYERELDDVLGAGGLDLVHLGLGADGHVASLVPDDALLEERRHRVGWSMAYQGVRRLSFTFRTLEEAEEVLILVSGAAKARALAQLMAQDVTVPAGRLPSAKLVVFADAKAASHLD